MMNEKGSATVGLSMVGAVAAGAPAISAVIITTDNLTGASTFVIAMLVGLLSIGAGVGKVYSRWRESIAASIERDKLLVDLCKRVERIEARQVHILEAIDRQHKN